MRIWMLKVGLTWEMLCQSSSPDGLVSILKRRRASLDGLPPPSITASKQNSKRKVRFSEPEDGAEPGIQSAICVPSNRGRPFPTSVGVSLFQRRSAAILASSCCCCASSLWWLALVGPPSTVCWWGATPAFALTSRRTSTSTLQTYEASSLASDAGCPCRCKLRTLAHGYVIVTFCGTQRPLLDVMYMTVVLHPSTLMFLPLF